MRQDQRPPFDEALRAARCAAYPPGEFVGQESFMDASEILALGRRAGIGPGASVLDLCCGVAGPGRFLASVLGGCYLGVDASASAVGLARERAGDLPCRFHVGHVPPVPSGPFDVILLLETMLAFPGKQVLLRGIASALAPGGRFACTVEEGRPLSVGERAAMPDADTVWPVVLSDLLRGLELAGLEVAWLGDHSEQHRARAEALVASFLTDHDAITARLGRRALDELVTGHRRWIEWLATGRVRKLALVATRADPRR